MAWVDLYSSTILAVGLMGLTLLLQMIVVGVAGMKAKHRPGYPIEPDHQSFLFRATRAQANSNESIAIFILLVLFGMLSSANPSYLGNLALLTVVGRIAHMLFYYIGVGLARSMAFAVTLFGLLGMAILSMNAWLS